jgi:hypothetical protein
MAKQEGNVIAKKAKKKATKKATAKAKATAEALPESEAIPEGFEEIGGGYAPTWRVEELAVLHGPVTGGVRDVELTIGRKKQTRRCMEVTRKKSGERFTVWESAALGDLFDQIAETGEGPEVYIRFDGLGKKKPGQNPPKLFTVAIKA